MSSERRFLEAACRSDLTTFIEACFNHLNPGTPFADNWHIEAIAFHLERVLSGDIRRLIISMPPRSLKSVSASIALPAFVHGWDPSRSIINVTYAQDLSSKLSNDYRSVLRSDWYRRIFPATRIDPRKDSEAEIALTGKGSRLATSVAGFSQVEAPTSSCWTTL